MDNRVLERIVIFILLLLDLVLLGIVLTDRAGARRSEKETADRVTAVLRDNGVTVDKSVAPVQAPPPRCTLERRNERELAIMKKLLGRNTAAEDMGGNILYFRSDLGQAVLRGSGETDVLLRLGTATLRGGPEKTCSRFLRRLRLTAEPWGSSGSPEEDGIDFLCRYGDYPVFNAVLHFDFSGDSIYMLTGTRIFDSLTEEDDSGLLDSVSALLRFTELLQSGEFSCTRLESFRPGYLLSVPVSGESILTPVWRLETDCGVLQINAENGKIEIEAA